MPVSAAKRTSRCNFVHFWYLVQCMLLRWKDSTFVFLMRKALRWKGLFCTSQLRSELYCPTLTFVGFFVPLFAELLHRWKIFTTLPIYWLHFLHHQTCSGVGLNGSFMCQIRDFCSVCYLCAVLHNPQRTKLRLVGLVEGPNFIAGYKADTSATQQFDHICNPHACSFSMLKLDNLTRSMWLISYKTFRLSPRW